MIGCNIIQGFLLIGKERVAAIMERIRLLLLFKSDIFVTHAHFGGLLLACSARGSEEVSFYMGTSSKWPKTCSLVCISIYIITLETHFIYSSVG